MSTNKEKVEAVLRDTLFETMSRSDLEKFAKTATAEVETLEAKVDELVSVHTADLSLIATMADEIASLKAALTAMEACEDDDHVCPQVVFENYERVREKQASKIRELEKDLEEYKQDLTISRVAHADTLEKFDYEDWRL
jgi:hypothetical protein